MNLPGLTQAELLHAPWDDPAFGYVVAATAVLLALAAVSLAVFTARGRGGASPHTLWARWLTWAVLAPLFAVAVFSGLLPVAVLMAVFALESTREWGALLGLPRAHRVLLTVYAVLAVALALFGAAALLATIPLLLLAALLQPVLRADTQRGMRDLAFGALGFAYLPLLLSYGVLMVRDIPNGAALLFATGAAASASDIGAYVAGKTIGRRRLAPTLSPNKTMGGLLGNVAGALLAIILLLPILPGAMPLTVLALALVIAVGAVWGDLFSSALKRESGVKDAGSWLPGFGGLLDRNRLLHPGRAARLLRGVAGRPALDRGGVAMTPVRTVIGPALDPAIAALSGDTLVELLERATSRTPESVAMIIRRGMADERWTYRQLSERVPRIAQNLQRAGVGPGDRVLTWSQNDPWLVAAYFAVWRAGAIIVPLDLRMQTDVAIRIGSRAEPTLLLAGHDVDTDAAAALGVPVLSVDEAGLDPGPQEPERPGPTVTSGDVAEIIFTSGTTSDPKGVVLTHGQIVHSARAITQTGRGKRPDRALAIVPMSHMYGQVVPLLAGFMTASTLVFLQALTPKIINSTMQRERITAVTLAPQVISILLQSVESEARRSGQEARLRRARRIARWLPFPLRRLLFRSLLDRLGGALEIISSGGAMLSPELQQAWELFGVRIVQGYGTTEAAVVCGHLRSRQRKGTVGPPLAGIEVRIAQDGELLVRGPNVMRGYWRAPEATADVLAPDGWLHTGDAARIDDSNELVILGRTRDRISLPSGLNVYPEDVEAALVDTGAVRAAVVFEPTPGRLAAVIVPRDPGSKEVELDAAVKQANATLASHQRLGTWRRWPDDDFPRTHTLKIRPAPVKAWYAEVGEGGGGSRATARPSQAPLPSGSPGRRYPTRSRSTRSWASSLPSSRMLEEPRCRVSAVPPRSAPWSSTR